MSRLILMLILVLAQVQGTERERRLAELRDLSSRLTTLIIEGRPQDLAPLLSYDIVVSREVALPTATVRKDLDAHGEIYCRIFDTKCARTPRLVSARDIFIKERANLNTAIRFYAPETDGKEDLDFAYITYSWGKNGSTYGWPEGVFVGLERIGQNWRISALFPTSY